MINISRPLCRGRLITLDDGKEHWVLFKYERLTNLCYWCGCPTHVDRDCEFWIESEGSLKPEDQQFGLWLRALPFQASRKKVVMMPSFFAKKCQSLPRQPPSTPHSQPQLTVLQTPTVYPSIPFGSVNETTENPRTQSCIGTTPPEVPGKPMVPFTPNLPNQTNFEDLIRDIDRDINRYDSEATALQNSNDIPPALNPNISSPPSHHSSPIPDRPGNQLNRPTPLSDLSKGI